MMLSQLRIENLLIIEQATLDLDRTLTVISGETGAGKTVLTKTFDLLAGGNGGSGLLFPGANEAYVEAVWELDDAERELWQTIVGDLTTVDSTVTVARRLTAKRSYGLINGRTCPLETLKTIAVHSLMLYGQYEQEQLNRPEQQRAIVDRGLQTEALWEAYTLARSEARKAQSARDRAYSSLQLARREHALIEHEHNELQAAGVAEGGSDEMFERLEALQSMRDQGDDVQRALELFERVVSELAEAERLANALSLQSDVAGARERASDAHYELHGRVDALEQYDPREEERLQEQLSALHALARKHRVQPNELGAVLETRASQLHAVAEIEEAFALAEARLERALSALARAGEALETARDERLPQWIEAVHEQLPAVALEGMRLRVEQTPRSGELLAQAGPAGLRDLRLQVQSGPGLPWGPVEQTASGGERSRLTLALVGLNGAGDRHVVVMDEPDTGIGGTTAHGIADRLAALGQQQQTIVVSHLTQIALRGARQYVVNKRLETDRTVTSIVAVEGEARVDELCRMSGFDAGDASRRAVIEEMLLQHAPVVESS
jgi:DNA repair protein RecN (Recombination protein N)